VSHESAVQSQFSTRVPVYDRRSAWIMDPGLLAAIVGACTAPASAELLDVCCGTGAVVGAFAGRVRRRTGFDLTAAMLDQARPRADHVVQGDARALPFADASFDVVVSRQAMHFFDDPSAPIREMARVLRPGGQLILAQRVAWGDADTAFWTELNFLKQPNLRTFILDEHLVGGMLAAGIRDIVASQHALWESIDDWVASPEVPEPNRAKILEMCRNASAEVRRVHPIEAGPDGVRCCWRWGIWAGTKG
jgi:ubiquinone/menaquinone biosynthesis C-methylase UbiE